MSSSMLSILTNFGCHFACPYCVYRDNGISIPKTTKDTFNWEKLEEEVAKRKGETISVSGGGDPLYRYVHPSQGDSWFYDRLFELLDKYGCGLELHTSMLNRWFPYDRCERVVFHFNMPTQIASLYWRDWTIKLPSKVRVVYVIQDHYTKHLIEEIVREVQIHILDINELSFRQRIDKDGKPSHHLHDFLKEGHGKRWYYIEQCDYNEYFVQDHIEREYLNIKGEE